MGYIYFIIEKCGFEYSGNSDFLGSMGVGEQSCISFQFTEHDVSDYINLI